MKNRFAALALVSVCALAAQQVSNIDRTLNCDDRNRSDGSRQRYCEMREFPGAAVPRLTVDGRTNGGVSVKGWDRSDMLVRARVETWAEGSEGQSMAKQITIETGATIRADAPDFGRDNGWSVSYEIFVPRHTGLSARMRNGGIRVSDLVGEMDLETRNGGVSLARVAGNVKAKTTNGGIKAELTGSRWEGNELNLLTTNGGVSITTPENYSARVEARTVNGGISGLPVSNQGRTREAAATLGSGGALIKAVTTNGGISFKRS